MPRGDKTGPMGNGSKTGRALGNCTDNNQTIIENNNSTYGRGNGYGNRNHKGNGYGRRLGYGLGQVALSSSKESIPNVKEETLIKNQINILKDQLESLEEKLSTLNK